MTVELCPKFCKFEVRYGGILTEIRVSKIPGRKSVVHHGHAPTTSSNLKFEACVSFSSLFAHSFMCHTHTVPRSLLHAHTQPHQSPWHRPISLIQSHRNQPSNNTTILRCGMRSLETASQHKSLLASETITPVVESLFSSADSIQNTSQSVHQSGKEYNGVSNQPSSLQ
jgi:hypothetical protein